MNGNSLFVDTNIVLYLLAGDETIADLLNGRHIFVSFITELELLGYKDIKAGDLKRIENFLSDSTIIDINSEIKKIATGLSKSHKIKLPDAIIAATSFYVNLPFLTADKGFLKLTELNILLYEK